MLLIQKIILLIGNKSAQLPQKKQHAQEKAVKFAANSWPGEQGMLGDNTNKRNHHF